MDNIPPPPPSFFHGIRFQYSMETLSMQLSMESMDNLQPGVSLEHL